MAPAAARRWSSWCATVLAFASRFPIVDLGAGTGANLRYLAPLIGGEQHWLLVDNDGELLALLPRWLSQWCQSTDMGLERRDELVVISGPSFECRVRWVCLDLSTGLNDLEIARHSLVSASALLDLVSERWIRGLASRCREAGASIYFSLTYDGRMRLFPSVEGDERIVTLVNRHQRTNKGFGAALGPCAVAVTKAVFGELGYQLSSATSDWRLGPDERVLQAALMDAWLEAASHMAPEESRYFKRWRTLREEWIDHLDASVEVGHEVGRDDVLAGKFHFEAVKTLSRDRRRHPRGFEHPFDASRGQTTCRLPCDRAAPPDAGNLLAGCHHRAVPLDVPSR